MKPVQPLKIGILGATGMVGQRFITLLEGHPWFKVVSLAASPESAGKKYSEAVKNRWSQSTPIPESVASLVVRGVEDDAEKIVAEVDLVFSALDLDKERIQAIENRYAASGIPVVSNNSAHRWTSDVPVIMPEINPDHMGLIETQRKNRGWNKGCIVVKPNCSIQSYVPVLTALKTFGVEKVIVTSAQAISGAGKTFTSWPEMVDNIIPFIKGEEEKSEKEPLKVWGVLKNGALELAKTPVISATCIRVPVADGHMASVSVQLSRTVTKEEIIEAIKNFKNPIAALELPSAPKNFITYYANDDRPQTKLDRDHEKGMGITIGRLTSDHLFGWKFVALSHNTVRGAAGGAILTAELMVAKGYVK